MVGYVMERRIEFRNDWKERIVGVYDRRKSEELLILCHGFQSSKEHQAIVRIARQLGAKGWSTLRFDFSGHGESEGDAELSIVKQVSEIGSAIRHIGKGHPKVILVGLSMGALITALAAIKFKRVSGLITLNGFFYMRGLKRQYFGFLLGAVFNRNLRESLGYYYREFKPENITVPVLVIHAEQDERVSCKQSKRFYSQLTAEKRIEQVPGDHDLSRQRHVAKVVEKVLAWLAGH
jgi:pimeloyl-ACP methyl ester carboxylesterase